MRGLLHGEHDDKNHDDGDDDDNNPDQVSREVLLCRRDEVVLTGQGRSRYSGGNRAL